MSLVADYKYPDGTSYSGEWNPQGQRNGKGKLTFADGALYNGQFENGMCSGVGIMVFPDGSRYEGEFAQGMFNGHGIFVRRDGMKYEGEFRDGKVWGYAMMLTLCNCYQFDFYKGLISFADGTHGLPRNEGYFEGSRLVRREKCPAAVHKAIQAADRARIP